MDAYLKRLTDSAAVYGNKLKETIGDIVRTYTTEAPKLKPPPEDIDKKALAEYHHHLERMRELNRTAYQEEHARTIAEYKEQSTELDQMLESREISYKDYIDQKKELIHDETHTELDNIQDRIDALPKETEALIKAMKADTNVHNQAAAEEEILKKKQITLDDLETQKFKANAADKTGIREQEIKWEQKRLDLIEVATKAIITAREKELSQLQELAQTYRDMATTLIEFGRSRGTVTAVQSYQYELTMLKQINAEEIKKLDTAKANFELEFAARWAKTHVLEQQPMKIEYAEFFRADAQSRINTEAKTTSEMLKLNIKYLNDLEHTYETAGFWGTVGQELDNLIIEYKKTWDKIKTLVDDTVSAMGDSFKELFTDMITGQMKKLGDYINSFLQKIATAVMNFVVDQMMAGLLSGIRNMMVALGVVKQTATYHQKSSRF